MTAEIKQIKPEPAPAPKTVKISIDEMAIPHVVDVWRCLEKMQKEDPKFVSGIPSIHHLYEFMARAPQFTGFVFRKNRKVVGMVLGQVIQIPSPIYFIAAEYLEPEFRKPELMEMAKVRLKEKLLRVGITHFARIGGKL